MKTTFVNGINPFPSWNTPEAAPLAIYKLKRPPNAAKPPKSVHRELWPGDEFLLPLLKTPKNSKEICDAIPQYSAGIIGKRLNYLTHTGIVSTLGREVRTERVGRGGRLGYMIYQLKSERLKLPCTQDS